MNKEEIMTAIAICANKEHGTCRDCPAWVDVDHSRCQEVLQGVLELLRNGKDDG